MKKYLIASTLVFCALIAFAAAQEYSFTTNLSVGATGPDVTALQNWLISNGYDIPAVISGAANRGYFGSQTKQALMKYQAAMGIPNTGYFGPMTRGRIKGDYRGGSLAVTSPNGGQIWKKGAVQNITWTGSSGVLNQTADIMLTFPLPACAQPGANPACAVKMRAPYTIAKGVKLTSGVYPWSVGSFIFDTATVPYCASDVSTSGNCVRSESVVDDGQYKIQICPTNGSQCDESDGEFTISTTGQAPANMPVISGVDAPTTLMVGQTGTWKVRASDPQNGSLSYSVDWGDISRAATASFQCPEGYLCQATTPAIQQTSTFTHTYSSPGIYTIRFTVRNDAGLATQSSVTVTVSPDRADPLRVISPNGGESWVKGTNQVINWTSPAYFRATYADLKLAPVVPPCTSNVCPMYALTMYTIANNISINQNSYTWRVGEYRDASDNNPNAGLKAPIPDGQYTIQICETGTNVCDSSDKPSTISSALVRICPDEKIVNRMPTVYSSQNPPATYYIVDGLRRELSEFDLSWVESQCTVPESVVY